MQVKMLFSCSHFKTDCEFQIDPILFTNNKSILKDEFSDKQFTYKIGLSTIETAFKESSFGYHIFDFPLLESEKYDDTQLIQQLHSFSYRVNYWWRFLWFAKDNSCHLNNLFVDIPEKHGCMIFSDFEKYSNSSGKYEMTNFTKENLIFINEIINKYSQYMEGTTVYSPDEYEVFRVSEDSNGVFQTKPKQYPYNNNRRIERAWMFLNFSRRAEFHPMKLSLFIPVFESLFSSGDIDRKVMSKRIANYLEVNRDENDKLINDAYLFRHKYIHGGELINYSVLSEQIELAKQIDEIIRKVFTKIIMNDLDKYSDKKGLYNWFNVLDRK